VAGLKRADQAEIDAARSEAVVDVAFLLCSAPDPRATHRRSELPDRRRQQRRTCGACGADADHPLGPVLLVRISKPPVPVIGNPDHTLANGELTSATARRQTDTYISMEILDNSRSTIIEERLHDSYRSARR
jgi:hypothetical protein